MSADPSPPPRSTAPPAAPRTPPPDTPPAPLDEAEQHRRAAYIERNLWLVLAGLLLFALGVW